MMEAMENTKSDAVSDLPVNRVGNLKTASGDENLKDILIHLKSSKTPAVINYGAGWCRVSNQILPTFWRLSNNFLKLSFIYADIDECPETEFLLLFAVPSRHQILMQ